MKKMHANARRPFICLALLLGLLVLALTGCHGKQGIPEFTVPETFDETKNYEITFWAKNDTNKAQTQIYEKAIADFQKLYPNITVKMRLYTDYGKIYNDVITNISTGTTPNVCITYPDHIATYMTGGGVMVELDNVMTNDEFGLGGSELRFDGPTKDDIISEYLSEGVLSGKQLALPFMRSTEACYINKDLVEALGYTVPDELTWDFIWEVSEAAAATKQADGTYTVNGQKVLIPFIYKSTDNMMIQLLYQADAPYSTEDGQILLFNDTTASFLKEIASHAKTGAFSTFKISGYPANFLNAGQCIFAVDSTAGSTWMGTDAPLSDIAEDKKAKFTTVVRTVPQLNPKSPEMISQGPSVCIFNKTDSQEVLASWLFTQYLLTNDIQIAYSETEGYVPVTSKARETEEYKEYLSLSGKDDAHYAVKIDATKMLLDNTSNTFTTPVFNGSASLRDAAGELVENVTKSVKRKAVVDDEYIKKLYTDVTALYHLGQGSGSSSGRADLGPLPGTAVALIVVLVVIWCLILVYVIVDRARMKKKGKQ